MQLSKVRFERRDALRKCRECSSYDGNDGIRTVRIGRSHSIAQSVDIDRLR